MTCARPSGGRGRDAPGVELSPASGTPRGSGGRRLAPDRAIRIIVHDAIPPWYEQMARAEILRARRGM